MNLRSIKMAGWMAVAAWAAAASGEDIALDGYAARVNDRVITRGDVALQMTPMERQLRQLYEGAELREKVREAYRKALAALVERALVLEEAKRLEMEIPPRAVEDQINRIISERYANNRTAFLEALAQDRMTEDEFRDQTKDSLSAMILRRQEVTDRVLVAPADVHAAYRERLEQYRQPEKVKLQMIVLGRGATGEDHRVKREQAERVRQRIMGGEDFGDLAREVSEGMKAESGGSWGWREPREFSEVIAAALKTLPVGQVSEVIEAADEYYLLFIEARQEASVTPFEDVEQRLVKELRQQEEMRMYEDWITKLKIRHYVRILAPELD